MFRVAVSKVRMPRSQRMTWVLPPSSRYSAASSHSSTVAENPRLRSTGRRTFPSARSRAKFCMFRAPTWSTSTWSIIEASCDVSSTSATTGSPWRAPDRPRIVSPASPRPWKA